ncbi:MAG: hypothetical protein P8Q18_08400 [Porticoccaceae bacterium]|jgi:hypothetical protein|nr:hypothetical protein [Porticoccaceae bacterium]MDB2554795.1 hypothetical protein [Porticoccaceae bacterium]MDG1447700.1 hypothetical protein [Porticoccaceae bacterium]
MKNIIKHSLMLVALVPAVSFASATSDWMPVEDGLAISGKIHAVKTSKKFRSVEKCRAFAEKKPSVVAFTLDLNKGTCTTFTSVRSRPSKSSASSQLKA